MAKMDWTNPRDLLTMLGFGSRTYYTRTGLDWFSGVGVFGVGLAVGAGVGLLLAPKPGRELRDDLSRRAGQLGDRIRRRMPEIDSQSEMANNIYDRTPSRG